ncbi:hypothetical protein [Streptomyces sp. NPDC057623]|uniref:glucosamine inositolphosphorylceramide transferase family protein n=1 Tax=Streptomyces sp. NPDC057623 TaxID=3346187 RepID=UPI00367881D2
MTTGSPIPELDPGTALRFAVLTDAAVPRHWHTRCLRALVAQGEICVALLRIAAPSTRRGRTGVLHDPARRSAALADADPDAFTCPAYDVEAGEVAARLAEHDLDFVLDLREWHPEITFQVPVHGVWRFSFPTLPARMAARALLDGDLTITAALIRTTVDGEHQALVDGRYGVVAASVARTTDRVLHGAAGFPSRAARAVRLRLPRPAVVRDRGQASPATATLGFLWRARLAFTMVSRRCAKALRDAVTETYWSIGVVKAPVESVMDGSVTGDQFHWHPGTRPDTYVADPIPLPGDPGVVYAEEFDHMTRHGRLIATTYSETEGWSGSEVVAQESFHMSYPYLFEHHGETLCVPETGWNNAVSVYRLQDPPRLEKDRDILTGVAAGDPTVFWWDGRWWMFYTDCFEPRDTDLYIWYASTPWGPWRPHLRNPVKSDVTSSRPAGAPFVREGRLLRPAQDDAGRYGWRMVVNEVVKLSPSEFAEVEVTRIGPFGSGPYPVGPHTLSVAGPHVYVDGKRSVVSLSLKARRLLGRLRARHAGRRHDSASKGH